MLARRSDLPGGGARVSRRHHGRRVGGNFGKAAEGRPVYGGITTPGNSPFAITVGALNTKGTPFRSDDEVASYSSKGPTMFDHLVKPDLVAPGNRILGLAAPGSRLVRAHPELVVSTPEGKRLQLSGTSMAAAVVSGAVSVLLEGGVQGTESVRRLLQHSSKAGSHLAGPGSQLDLAVALEPGFTATWSRKVTGAISRSDDAPTDGTCIASASSLSEAS